MFNIISLFLIQQLDDIFPTLPVLLCIQYLSGLDIILLDANLLLQRATDAAEQRHCNPFCAYNIEKHFKSSRG